MSTSPFTAAGRLEQSIALSADALVHQQEDSATIVEMIARSRELIARSRDLIRNIDEQVAVFQPSPDVAVEP